MMTLYEDMVALRRPSTAPLPSHTPQESRSFSPDFFFMPPVAADDLALGATPDYPTPPPLIDSSGYANAFQYARRPSRDALQTHFALETIYSSMDQSSAMPRTLAPTEISAWTQIQPSATVVPAAAADIKPAPVKTSSPKVLRPPNAWILYRSDKLAEAKSSQGQRTPQAELSKHIAESWRAEKPEVKRSYERQAELRKLQHEAQHPGYKFQPKKRGRATYVSKTKPNTRKRAATVSSNSGTDAPGSLVSSRATSPSTPPSSAPQYINEPLVAPGATWTPSRLPGDVRPATAVEPWTGTAFHRSSEIAQQASRPLSPRQPASAFWATDPRIGAPAGSGGEPGGRHTADFHNPTGPVYFDHPVPQTAPPCSTAYPHGSSAYHREPAHDTFAFVPPPLDYQFPHPAGQYPPSLQTSPSLASTCSASTFSPPATASTAEGACGMPAWWPFRDVKVVRDDLHGTRLESFLEEMAEREGIQRARYALEMSYHASPRPDTGRPDTAYSMIPEEPLYSSTPLVIQS